MTSKDPSRVELPGTLPEETRIAGSVLPPTSSTPTGDLPTPGLATSAARLPPGPTLPDWDPATLGLLVQKLANELFAPSSTALPSAAPAGSMPVGPTAAGMPATPTPPGGPAAPAVPALAPVAEPAWPAAAAPAASSPFAMPLSFDSLGALSMTDWSFTLPLVDDGRAAPAAPPSAPIAAPAAAPVASPPGPSSAAPPGPSSAAPPGPSSAAPSGPSSAVPSGPSSAAPSGSLSPAGGEGWGEGVFDGAPVAPDVAAPYWYAPPAKMPAEPAPAVPEPVVAHEIAPATAPDVRPSAGIFDPHALRREFPILQERVHGKRLVWLDNAATTQKPAAVIDRLSAFYAHENSNIHRAAHTLAARATDAYESARETVRRFINAPSSKEIVFVRGTTEAINLVAQSWGRRNVEKGDEIVITWLEHHANIVPWQMLCAEKGARLRVVPVDDRGQVILEEYEKLLGPKTRIVAFSQVSNALGTVTPAREMIEMAHRHGAKVLLDGAQAVSHMRVDVQALDCDFFVFSGHKVFAPTGIGVVFGKLPLLEQMPPWQGGGNMIQDVTFERTVYQSPPFRFEAGTGNIADAVGLGTALDWLSRIGVENVGRYEHDLLEYATACLRTVPGLTIIGTAPDKAGVISFVLAGQKTEEVGGLLDKEGIAVRSGHHCAQPILRRFGLEATVRASLAPYNTREDIDALVAALKRLQSGHAEVK